MRSALFNLIFGSVCVKMKSESEVSDRMDYFLDIDENNEEKTRLELAFKNDPYQVEQDVCRIVHLCSISDALLKEHAVFLSQTDAQFQWLLEEIARFQSAIPKRSSMFRGGEDSQGMYRLLCPMMERMTSFRSRLRKECFAVSSNCERINRSLVALARLEWQCDVLQGMCDKENDFSKTVEKIENERAVLKGLLELLQAVSKLISHFDTEVLERVVTELGHVSDFEHEGMNCDCMAVLAAFSALEQATRSIKKEFAKRGY